MDEYLQRQGFLGPKSTEVLRGSTAGIIGLCGGGSHIAQQLAHIGVGRFKLFDHDRAEDTNLNRMVGLTRVRADREDMKTDVISDLIRGINPEAKIEVFAMKWQNAHEALRDCTACFGCVDSYGERDQLERYARRYMIPYIDVGMDVHGSPGAASISGQVILSMPGELCMRCMGFLTDDKLAEEGRRYGNAGPRPQVVWPNGTLASTAIGMFMSLLTPWRQGVQPAPYMEYDGNRLTMGPSRRLEHLKDKTCPHFSGAGALGDAF